MHHLPTSLVSNERANCIVYRSLFPVDFHLWSWYHCFLLHRRLRGGWLLYRVSASPGSLESHSIVGQTLRQLKPQLCLECWPAGLRWPALLLLPGLCELTNGERAALKRNTVLLPVWGGQVGNPIWQRNGHFVPAQNEKLSKPDIGADTIGWAEQPICCGGF